MEVENGLLLPIFQPPVAWNLAVVLVDFAVTFFPVVIFAGFQPSPIQKLFTGKFCSFRPVFEVIDDRVTNIVGDPDAFQRSPLAFFALTFSSINSAMTSFLIASLASICSIF